MNKIILSCRGPFLQGSIKGGGGPGGLLGNRGGGVGGGDVACVCVQMHRVSVLNSYPDPLNPPNFQNPVISKRNPNASA